ncbi:MAG: hypothetical protein QGH91_07265 [Candidatus Marinimicrobia bacterium]|nr:hypothetical protein [Candidatus Neomarinimicrobiota bacterium]MDP7437593.1 hypothetical protein [Candidatus Neomarinimicrobiota bacterium]MDP7653316.1 hypothetical protein [Candidatus Neomarinimicrobiota bacterium]|tara:strand:+ start:2460 stop:2888 length:429 start_codon:yes stop_codon:yes gene_type:complete
MMKYMFKICALSVLVTFMFASGSQLVGKWKVDMAFIDKIIAADSSFQDMDKEMQEMAVKMMKEQFNLQMEYRKDGTMTDPDGKDAKWKMRGKSIMLLYPDSDEWIQLPAKIVKGVLYFGEGKLEERMPFVKVVEKEVDKKSK